MKAYVLTRVTYGVLEHDAKAFNSHDEAFKEMVDDLWRELATYGEEVERSDGEPVLTDNGMYELRKDYAFFDDNWWNIHEVEV